MASIGTRLYTLLRGKYVGQDDFGNRYYCSRKASDGRGVGRANTERRWVVYAGLAEPSKVPPVWHGWLHHMTDALPDDEARDGASKKTYAWEKEAQPNLTGTQLAYRPPGHITQGAKRAKATGDYEPWQPQ